MCKHSVCLTVCIEKVMLTENNYVPNVVNVYSVIPGQLAPNVLLNNDTIAVPSSYQ